VQEDHVADVVDGVGHVVEPFGQLKDVIAVEAGDEGGGQPGEDGPGEAVALMLQLGQLLGLGLGSARSASRSTRTVAAAMVSAAAQNSSK